MAYESQQPQWNLTDPRLLPITTPLHVGVWAQCLASHPDKQFAQYITQGLHRGFRIGFDASSPLKAASRNMSSTAEQHDIVSKYLQEEITEGRILGPFTPGELTTPIHTSPIGIIPKRHQPNKWRLIVDMSSPDEYSINDGISTELSSLTYIKIQDIIKEILQLGPGTELAKIDIQSAYRIIPINPVDRHLLGMAWDGKINIDACLPFGLRSAPKIFSAVADALSWIILQHGASILFHYLDDFATMGPAGQGTCEANLRILLALCELLGVPIASQKSRGPCTCLEYIGFVLDTIAMEVRLSQEKLARLVNTIRAWQARKFCTKHELESLIGQLQHASAVVRPGRSFLRRMIILAKSKSNPSHPLRLNTSFRADLAWWSLFLEQWNGISMMSAVGNHLPAYTLTSDASGHWGCGAFSGSSWFQVQWNAKSADYSIATKELIPIILAAIAWGKRWQGSTVQAWCDNAAVVAVINSRYSRDEQLMHLLRCLFFVEAKFQIQIVAEHIPGHQNVLADDLSRDRVSSFLSKAPHMDPHPTTIPPEVIPALLAQPPNWLFPNWTTSWGSILSRV